MSIRSKEHSRIPFVHVAGVTLVELMVTLAVIAISLTLAVPAYNDFREKRKIRKGTEELISLVNYAQSAAVKLNQEVRVSWGTRFEYPSWLFCIGATDVEDTTCDCFTANSCMVDGSELSMEMSEPDFLPPSAIWSGHFTFDPVRGIVTNPSNSAVFSTNYLFWIRSGSYEDWQTTGERAAYSIMTRLNITGRLEACLHTNSTYKMLAGGLPKC